MKRGRLDLTRATQHDIFAKEDYDRLREIGILAARDGVSWPHSEIRPGEYDFTRFRMMLDASRRARVSVIWDLLHFGWPDHVNVLARDFPERFARYAAAFAHVLKEYREGMSGPPIVSPINEISFLSWAAGDEAIFYPFLRERAPELKFQFVRAAIAGMQSVRHVLPDALFLHCDPIIHVAPRNKGSLEAPVAEYLRLLQFQAWDMISGRSWGAQLDGRDNYLNIIGVNYYRNNQRFVDGEFIDGTDSRYRPLASMLLEVWMRYRKPLLVSETGAEDSDRPRWLTYVVSECLTAMKAGCPILGVTWYPIVNHPGWEDDRHIHNGLWDYADRTGYREAYAPLAREFLRLGPILSRCTSLAFASDVR